MNDQLQQSLVDLETSLKEIDSAVKIIKKTENLATTIIEETSSILESITNQISILDREIKEWTENFGKETEMIIEKFETFCKKYEELATSTDRLVDFLKKIDFPVRLNQMDEGIQGINSAVNEISQEIDQQSKAVLETIQNNNIQIINNKKLIIALAALAIVNIVISFVLIIR